MDGISGIGAINGMSINGVVLSDRFKEFEAIGAGIPFMSPIRARDGMANHQHRIMPLNNYRAMYEFLRSIYPHSVLISDGFLRAVIQPTNGATQFTFVLNKNDNGSSGISTNNLLDQSDTFETLYFRFGMYTLSTTAAGNGILSAGVTHSQAIPQYFVNPQVFTEAAEIAGLQSIYTGFTYIKIGTIVYYEQFQSRNFKQVGVSQQGVAVSAVPTAGVIGETSEHEEHKALVTPVVMIDGSGKNVFQMNSFDPMVCQPTTRSFTNFFFFEALGFKCQEGAKQETMKFKVGTQALNP